MTDVDATSRSGSAVSAYVLLTLTALCWGANTVFGRLAVGQVSPMALVSLRWLSVSIFLLLFARRELSDDWPRVRPRLPFVFAMGGLGFTAFLRPWSAAPAGSSTCREVRIYGQIPNSAAFEVLPQRLPIMLLPPAVVIWRLAGWHLRMDHP